MQCNTGREREHSISPKTPTPQNQPIEVRKKQNSRRQKRMSRSRQQESIGSALETRKSHTIKHRVTKIVPKLHREEHKGSDILRSPTTWRRERVPMSNQSTTSNTRRHKHAPFQHKGNAPLRGCIGLLLILNSMHNSATDRRWARLQSKTVPARKLALLTTLSGNLRCEPVAEHHTAEQYSKTGITKLKKDLRRSDRSWNTCQDFLIILASELQHWKQSDGAFQR